MPWTAGETRRLMLVMRAPWRRWFGDRPVRRRVQGTVLILPRSHMLPHYARVRPGYGQNLVQLAARLGRTRTGPLAVLDIGANVGDSTLQILAATAARVVCVEADPYWADYLHLNVGERDDVDMETALLVPDRAVVRAVHAVRDNGTTRFAEHGGDEAQPALSVSSLRDRHPELGNLGLVKSDTDGHDTTLVPAVIRAWAAERPVVFFEYDPMLTRAAGHDPERVWDELAELGYRKLVVWDNAGDPLGSMDVGQARGFARTLEPRPIELGYHFWDVAACHEDDAAALAVLGELVPMAFDVAGLRR